MPEPVAISAEARAAAADGPMPLTDAAAVAAQQAAEPLRQRHPAAGTRFDDLTPDDLIASLRRQVMALQGALAEEKRKRADADVRIAGYETAERTDACPGCLGHRRAIADLERARTEDRRLLAAVTLGRVGDE